MSAGAYHTCAIKTDGTLTCWGYNGDEQASPPSGLFGGAHLPTVDAGYYHTCAIKPTAPWPAGVTTSTARLARPTGTFTAVSAGGSHTCAIRTGGSIACWGEDSSSQSDPPAGTFVDVSAGALDTCALQDNGTLVCWGDQTYGESSPPTGTYTEVSAGGFFNCAIKTDGTLACWGESSYSQTVPPAGKYIAVAAGFFSACAIKTDGTIACWGSNTGYNTTPPAGKYVALSSGYLHHCAIATDGTLSCWGDNSYNQSSPPSGTFTSVSASENHTCAVRTDGTVVCWGENGDGQSTVPAVKLVVSGFPSPTTAGVAHNVTVTAKDPFGATAIGYTGTVHLSSTDAAAVLPAAYTFTASDAGVHAFSVALKTAGTQSVTATDTATSSITGSQSGIVVNPGAATHLSVSGYPSPTTVGVAHSVTVKALDAYGNTATGYAGTVHITSSDGAATLAANAKLTSGVGTFGVTLRTAGTQSVTATDTTTASITGSQSVVVAPPASTYHATSPARVLDSRPTGSGHTNIGLSGKFTAGTVRTFAVAGVIGVGASSAPYRPMPPRSRATSPS